MKGQRRVRWGLPSVVWALAACHFVSRVAGLGQTFLVLYLAQDRRLSTVTAGGVAAAVGLGTVGSLLLGGWLSDRFGRRPTMLAGFVGTAVALIGLGSARSLPAISAAAVGVGLASELFRPAGSATVADLPHPQERVRAFGLLFWATNLGFSVSALSAGVLVRHGYGMLFWLGAAASIIAAVIVWRLVPETRPPIAPATRHGLLAVVIHDRVTIAIALIFVGYFALFAQAFATLPLTITAHGIGPSTFAAVLAVNGVAILATQPLAVLLLADRDRCTVLGASILLVGVGLGFGTVAHSAAGYLGSALVWTAGEIGIAVIFGPVFADLAPTDLRGGYMAVAATTWAVGTTLGPLLGTAMLDQAGPTALWLTCAATGIALFAAAHAIAPALRNRTSVHSQPDPVVGRDGSPSRRPHVRTDTRQGSAVTTHLPASARVRMTRYEGGETS